MAVSRIVVVRQGSKYGPEYVTALRRQVEAFSTRAFVVVGDDDDADVRLRHGLVGWWAKLELFSPELAHLRPFFFLDLDTYITGDIDSSLDRLPLERLLLLRDFNRQHRGNSGLMLVPHETAGVWDAFRRGGRPSYGGDGDFLNAQPHGYLDDYMRFFSYKKHCREAMRLPIVCFHGKPKPHEADGWAAEWWARWT